MALASKPAPKDRLKGKWLGADLNRRHPHFQCGALPTELPSLTAENARPARLSPRPCLSTPALSQPAVTGFLQRANSLNLILIYIRGRQPEHTHHRPRRRGVKTTGTRHRKNPLEVQRFTAARSGPAPACLAVNPSPRRPSRIPGPDMGHPDITHGPRAPESINPVFQVVIAGISTFQPPVRVQAVPRAMWRTQDKMGVYLPGLTATGGSVQFFFLAKRPVERH
jgi:hypothetical protein